MKARSVGPARQSKVREIKSRLIANYRESHQRDQARAGAAMVRKALHDVRHKLEAAADVVAVLARYPASESSDHYHDAAAAMQTVSRELHHAGLLTESTALMTTLHRWSLYANRAIENCQNDRHVSSATRLCASEIRKYATALGIKYSTYEMGPAAKLLVEVAKAAGHSALTIAAAAKALKPERPKTVRTRPGKPAA